MVVDFKVKQFNTKSLHFSDIYSLKNFLESNNFQVDDKDNNGATILMHAAARGTPASAFVKELVLRGADIQSEDFDNWTALLYATKGGHYEIVQYLLDHGADIEHRDMGGGFLLLSSHALHIVCTSNKQRNLSRH